MIAVSNALVFFGAPWPPIFPRCALSGSSPSNPAKPGRCLLSLYHYVIVYPERTRYSRYAHAHVNMSCVNEDKHKTSRLAPHKPWNTPPASIARIRRCWRICCRAASALALFAESDLRVSVRANAESTGAFLISHQQAEPK